MVLLVHVHAHDPPSAGKGGETRDATGGNRLDLARGVGAGAAVCRHGRRGQSQSDVGEIARGVVLGHPRAPFDHTRFDRFPLALANGPDD